MQLSFPHLWKSQGSGHPEVQWISPTLGKPPSRYLPCQVSTYIKLFSMYIYTGWKKSRFTVTSMQNTIFKLLFTNYCIIFHMNNRKCTLPLPCLYLISEESPNISLHNIKSGERVSHFSFCIFLYCLSFLTT